MINLSDRLPWLREVVESLLGHQKPLDHPASLFGPWLGPRP